MRVIARLESGNAANGLPVPDFGVPLLRADAGSRVFPRSVRLLGQCHHRRRARLRRGWLRGSDQAFSFRPLAFRQRAFPKGIATRHRHHLTAARAPRYAAWMRYRLRTLLIALALGPPLLAGVWILGQSAIAESLERQQRTSDLKRIGLGLKNYSGGNMFISLPPGARPRRVLPDEMDCSSDEDSY